MRTCLFLSSELVTEDELRNFVEQHDGTWHDTCDIRQGVFQTGEAAVILSLSNDELQLLGESELQDARDKLGCQPVTAIAIGITSDTEAEEMANAIVQAIDNEWGGFLAADSE